MTSLQEYDLKVKLTYNIKGHGLCKLVAEVLDLKIENIIYWDNEIKM